MKRWVTVLAGCALVLTLVGESLLVWRFARHQGPQYPQISAYSRGQTVRVGPYLYCTPTIDDNVISIKDCVEPQQTGSVRVDADTPVQLSVPETLATAPWWLSASYDLADLEGPHPQGRSRTMSIPTVDPARGKLRYFVVGLPYADGNYYAEWRVDAVWPDENEAR